MQQSHKVSEVSTSVPEIKAQDSPGDPRVAEPHVTKPNKAPSRLLPSEGQHSNTQPAVTLTRGIRTTFHSLKLVVLLCRHCKHNVLFKH